MDETIDNFLIDFYKTKNNEDVSLEKISKIKNAYKGDYDLLINDLYDKYDAGGLNDQKLVNIKSAYKLNNSDVDTEPEKELVAETVVETEPEKESKEDEIFRRTGFTKGETYGTGTKLKKQIEQGGPLPSDTRLFTAAANTPPPAIDRPTERQEESIMTGAQTIQPSNFTVSNSQGNVIARPGTQYKNSDMVSAYVQSGFNDDILNILIRTT